MENVNPYLKKRFIAYDAILRLPVINSLRKKETQMLAKIYRSNIREGETILEIGSGSGYYTEQLIALTPNILCIEEAPGMIAEFEQRFQNLDRQPPRVIQGKFPDIEPDKQFDHVIAIGVLEYTADPKRFLTQASLRAKKSLIFTAVERYLWGRIGQKIATILFKETIFPYSRAQITQWLKPLNVSIHSVSLPSPFSTTTLVCVVDKSLA